MTNQGHLPDDLELISSYIDGQLSATEREQFETRLAREPALRAELDSVQATVSLLREMPRLKAPRNFTLDPAIYGKPKPQSITKQPAKVVRFNPNRWSGVIGFAASLVLIISGVLLGGFDQPRHAGDAVYVQPSPERTFEEIPTANVFAFDSTEEVSQDTDLFESNPVGEGAVSDAGRNMGEAEETQASNIPDETTVEPDLTLERSEVYNDDGYPDEGMGEDGMGYDLPPGGDGYGGGNGGSNGGGGPNEPPMTGTGGGNGGVPDGAVVIPFGTTLIPTEDPSVAIMGENEGEPSSAEAPIPESQAGEEDAVAVNGTSIPQAVGDMDQTPIAETQFEVPSEKAGSAPSKVATYSTQVDTATKTGRWLIGGGVIGIALSLGVLFQRRRRHSQH